MDAKAILRKLLAQREFVVDLGEGKKVRVRRPAETEIASLIVRNAEGEAVGIKFDLAAVQQHTVGWEGFTEADLIAGGASDAVDFDAGLWGALVADKLEWLGKIAERAIAEIQAHGERTRAASGN